VKDQKKHKCQCRRRRICKCRDTKKPKSYVNPNFHPKRRQHKKHHKQSFVKPIVKPYGYFDAVKANATATVTATVV